MNDKQYRWVIVGYTLILQAVNIGTLIYCFSLFAVSWLDEFSASRRDVMFTISLLQIGSGICSPFVGRALDKYATRPLIFVGLGMLILGLFLVSQAQALWQIQLVYAFIFPLSATLSGTLASQTLIAKWFTDNRGFAIGLSATGTNLGGIILPLLVAGWLMDIGWRDTLTLLAIIAFVLIAPITWFLLRRSPSRSETSTTPSAHDVRLWSTREILSTRMFWIPMLSLLPLNLAFGGVIFNLGAYSKDLGFDTETSGMLLALSSFCMVLGKFFFGALGDRMDHRYLYWIAAFFMVSSMIILQMAPTLWLLAIAVIGVGLAGGGILPLLGLIFGSRFGVASFGRVMGFAMISISLGSLGPLLAGWAHDISGDYNSAFMLFAFAFLPAVIAMRWLPATASD